MAGVSPKSGHKSTVMNVAVVGLTSSSQGDQGEGSGKSCLCNKFITPHEDHYYSSHPYIVNLSEFGNSVINNCHFLYWGDKVTALEDGTDVSFRVIEHTEFVDDLSLKPFSAQKPYNKRITITKLQSGGKLQYVAPNQLTLPDDYPNVSRFPDKLTVEGFVVCVDVQGDFSPNSQYKTDTLKLIQAVQGTKKSVVIALTKCDRVGNAKVLEIEELLSKLKRSPPLIQVSAHENVNVDLCFLTLAHLIDSRKPKVRMIPYEEAHTVIKERRTKNEKLLKALLDKKLTDFTMCKQDAYKVVKGEPEWESVAQLMGTPRCEKLVNIKLGQLHVAAVMKQTDIFKEILPEYLKNVLPEVTLDVTVDECLEEIKNHQEFDEYFVHIKNWTDDVDFIHTFSHKVPYTFVSKEGKKIVQDHIDSLKLNIRQEEAKTKIREILQNTEYLQPGVKVLVAMEKLGLSEEAKLLEIPILQKIYQEKLDVVEQKCADDIHELLLERLDLFHDYTPGPKEIIDKLMDEPRMKKMELALTRRNGIIVKHISMLEVLDRGPYFNPEILEILEKDTPSLESLQDSMKGCWVSNPDTEVFNLVLLSSNSEEASILKSDIMNQCTGTDVYEVDHNHSYQLRMKCCHTGHEEMKSEKYIPHGLMGVVSSMNHLEWLGNYLNRNMLNKETSKYSGMPCVVIVITASDKDSDLVDQCKQLCSRLQCVMVSTPPTDLPGRLVKPEIVNSALSSLFDNFSLTHSFLFDGPKRELDGLNFGVFCLPGDPNVSTLLKSLLFSNQLIHYLAKDRICFTKTALERQHKVVSLSFYSTINARDFGLYPVIGFMIFYSTDRKASLSAVKWLVPRLHPIPILLVAVCGDNSSPLLEEGRSYAKERGERVEFVTCHSQLEASRLSKFYSDCFFSRFSSWRNQRLSDDVSARILKRRVTGNPRPLPLPSNNTQTLPHNISRHSVAHFGDFERNSPMFSTMTGRNKPKKPMAPVSMSDDELDDSVYTDPNEVLKKITQPLNVPSTTKGNKYNSSPEISRTAPVKVGGDKDRFNTLPHDATLEYAMVPSSNTIGKLDTLTRQRRTVHETSPSRKSSSTTPDDSAKVSNDSLYSPVRETGGFATRKIMSDHSSSVSRSPSPPSIHPKAMLYDHLTPKTQRKRLQEMQENNSFETPVGIYSEATNTSPQATRQGDHMYSSFNNTQIQLGQIQDQFLEVAEGIQLPRSSNNSLKRSESPVAIYDFCGDPDPGVDDGGISREPLTKAKLSMESYHVKTIDGSPSPQRKPPPPYSSSMDSAGMYDYASLPQTRYSLQTQSHEGTPEATYSLAEEVSVHQRPPITPPGQSPLVTQRNVTPPPIIPPKPSNLSASPDANYWSRKGTDLRHTPTHTPPQTRAIEHITPSEGDSDAIYALPEKKKKPPNIQHVIAAEDSIYALPDKPKRHVQQDEDDDDDDDEEAPPLPPRNYDTSDIEDDDEECLHSDEEEDEKLHKPVKSTSAAPIGIYASVGAITEDESSETISTSSSSHADLSEMDQIESIYMNLRDFQKKQTQQQQQEESIYDTLEKVIEVVNKGSQPLEATPTASGGAPLPISEMPTGVNMPKLSKKAIKLLKKIEKKAQKEKEKRIKQDAKRKKKEEEKKRKMEKALKKGKKIKQPTRKRYFESPLSSVVGEDGIPSFIKVCVELVEEDGLDSEGLYRISGKKEDIIRIQEAVDQDPNTDITTLGVCVNAITGTLKSFFKVLPDPLITEDLLTPLLDIPGSEGQTKQMQNILSKLPRENLKTLRYLCVHLNKVQKNHEVNKMNASNLSIVFWPTLMRPPIMDMVNPTKQLGWQLSMAKMIENPECVPEVD